MEFLLVTGAYRSGTTLTDKLLHQHPEASVASQPFPYLYIGAKRALLAELGHADHYPLGSCFLEGRYGRAELIDFLERHEFSTAELAGLTAENTAYSGGLTPELADVAAALRAGTFPELFEAIHRGLAESLGRPGARVAGAKEILVEEFVAPLLGWGHRVLLLVRDPRSVVASLTSGRGQDYGGGLRPTLFHLRNWRRSAATALAFADQPRFCACRFEDVLAGGGVLPERVWEWLGLEVPTEPVPTTDQQGRRWRDNSSFADPPGSLEESAERTRSRLPAEVLAYVEACTEAELAALGYPLLTSADERAAVLERFEDPYPIERTLPPADLSGRASSLAQERARRELLAGPDLPVEVQRLWFLHEAAWQRLRSSP